MRKIVLAITLVCAPAVVAVAAPERPAPQDKIDPAVVAAIDSGKTVPVVILGKKQLLEPLGGLDAFAQKNRAAERLRLRATVLAELKRIAASEQPRILRQLGKEHADRRLWLINAMVVTLTPAEVRQAAELDDVRFIYPSNETFPPPESPGRVAVVLPAKQKRAAFTPEGKRIAWNVERLGAPRVWSEFADYGDGVVVALMDVGVNYNHRDLRGNIWVNAREVAANGKDDDNNGYIDDLYGYDFGNMRAEVRDTSSTTQHGTMTSGIVAGDGSGGIVTGVAPRARIMPMRGGGITDNMLGFQYALENGADIMSMSFSLPNLGNIRGLWRMLSDHAVAAGLVLVGGAGNFQQSAQIPYQHQSPKDVPSVISVGGIDTLMQVVPFSSLGPAEWGTVAVFGDYPMPKGLVKPDLVAFPGPGYPMLGVGDDVYIDPNPNRRGNSFSGPQGAGVAALMLSANPRLPAWRVKEILEQTAIDLADKGKDNRTGSGLIDAYAAVKAARSAK